jgi:hypothetical protein
VEYANTVNDLFGPAYAKIAEEMDPGDAAFEGFRNDIAVTVVDSKTFEQLRSVAAKISTALPAADLLKIAGCSATTSACQTQFVRNLGRLLYRRPLVDDDLVALLPLFAVAADDPVPFERGARLVLATMLQAPAFLYRLETKKPIDPRSNRPAGPGPFEMATRLSYLVWASTPSAELLAAAEKGELLTPPSIGGQLEAMLADPRARRGARVFADEWLALYRNVTIRRPRPDLGVTPALLGDMRLETLDFVERIALGRDTDLMSLFTDLRTRVTPALGKVYGVALTAPAVIDLGALKNRVGLLTQPGFLGINAGEAQASIVDRAMAVRDHLLCLPPLSTPQGLDVAAIFEKTDPNLSERDRFAQHRTDSRCAACHEQIEPFGYAFEVFDLVGRAIDKDAAGHVLRGNGEMVLDEVKQPYANVREFAGILGKSPSVAACVANRFIRYAMGREVASTEAVEKTTQDAFRAAGRTYTALVRATGLSESFRAAGPEVLQ